MAVFSTNGVPDNVLKRIITDEVVDYFREQAVDKAWWKYANIGIVTPDANGVYPEKLIGVDMDYRDRSDNSYSTDININEITTANQTLQTHAVRIKERNTDGLLLSTDRYRLSDIVKSTSDLSYDFNNVLIEQLSQTLLDRLNVFFSRSCYVNYGSSAVVTQTLIDAGTYTQPELGMPILHTTPNGLIGRNATVVNALSLNPNFFHDIVVDTKIQFGVPLEDYMCLTGSYLFHLMVTETFDQSVLSAADRKLYLNRLLESPLNIVDEFEYHGINVVDMGSGITVKGTAVAINGTGGITYIQRDGTGTNDATFRSILMVPKGYQNWVMRYAEPEIIIAQPDEDSLSQNPYVSLQVRCFAETNDFGDGAHLYHRSNI